MVEPTDDDGPREAGPRPIEDEGLERLPLPSPGGRFVMRPAVQGADSTCNTGWTFICETHPPGQTCTTGWTFKCDTGTCSWGFTLICDRRPLSRQ